MEKFCANKILTQRKVAGLHNQKQFRNFLMELAGLYSNPLKRITAFKRSHSEEPLSGVDASGIASPNINSLAHFRQNSKYGDREVTRYRQKQKILSDKEKLEIVTRYQDGESTYDLAKAYDCHRSTISNNLKKAGIDVSIEKINLDEAIRLYESGCTTKDIAAKYHMTDNAVSRRLKAAGVKMRTRWDYTRR